jgi:hypothetical protein
VDFSLPLLLVVLATLITVGWIGLLLMLAKYGKPAEDSGTSFTLRHSAALRYFSILSLFGGGAIFGFWAALVPPQSETLAYAFALGAIALAAFGFALLWESYRWRLRVDAAGLDCRSPWKAPRNAKWNEIKSVNYSKMNGWHVITFADDSSFRVPAIVPGTRRFLDEYRKHQP